MQMGEVLRFFPMGLHPACCFSSGRIYHAALSEVVIPKTITNV